MSENREELKEMLEELYNNIDEAVQQCQDIIYHSEDSGSEDISDLNQVECVLQTALGELSDWASSNDLWD